jgi:phage shock protein C
MAQRPLTRSKTDRIVSGVCGGIAATYGFDSVLVRGAFVVLALMNPPVACVVYIAALFLVPEETPTPTVPTQHPGWRFDPWTGDRIQMHHDDVIVDTAPAAAATASSPVDSTPGAPASTSSTVDSAAAPAPDGTPETHSSPGAPSETDTRSAHIQTD